ncbi:MAG: ribosome-associated translation inhibitor RaiA [Acidobacteriota bacterium]|nr:ribosome-associated translation inhibitor RaiA [Acidobacteriota bacterium]MDQ5872577.1 ribosome-associated translation inhibitor RaiA [Acidobacteriota bacterium]
MAVECTGRNVEVTPALKNLARERAERLERHLGGPANVRIVLSHEKHRFGAEIIATHRRQRWNAREYTTADPKAAVALAFEKIDAQAMKDAEKRRDRKNRVSQRLLEPEPPAPAPSTRKAARSSPPAPRGRRIVRTRRLAMKPMSIEEAALSIEDSEQEFLVFRDSSTEKVAVIYKRRDGNLGLIEC